MLISELASSIHAVVNQLNKAHNEIIAKQDDLLTRISSLEALLAAAGEIPAEAQDAIAGLKVAALALDDVVPDPVEGGPVDGGPGYEG